jgi:hypothetical protein
MDEFMLTPADLEGYEARHGRTAAATLLLLTPPDRYTGDWMDAFERLTTDLTTKPQPEMQLNDTF